MNFLDKMYKCNVCGKIVKTKALMGRHMNQHAATKKRFLCLYCPEMFNVYENFEIHQSIHNKYELRCSKCNKLFNRLSSLQGHVKIHYQNEYYQQFGDKILAENGLAVNIVETPRPLEKSPSIVKEKLKNVCKFCSKSFPKPSLLERHIRIHTKEKPFKCDNCEKRFTQNITRQIHQLQHKGVKPHQCQICAMQFSQKGNLKMHMKRVHANKILPLQNQFPCIFCPCTFKTLGSLNAHKSKRHKQFLPDISDKNKPPLAISTEQRRLQNPDKNKHNCPKCKKNFHKNSTLNRHLKTHEKVKVRCRAKEIGAMVPDVIPKPRNNSKEYLLGPNENRIHACEICPAAFKQLSALKDHVASHVGLKTFRCPHCDKLFGRRNSLNIHLNTHTRLKLFSCNYCDSRFTTKTSLKRHVLRSRKKSGNICPKIPESDNTLPITTQPAGTVEDEEEVVFEHPLEENLPSEINNEVFLADNSTIDLNDLNLDMNNVDNCIFLIDQQYCVLQDGVLVPCVGDSFIISDEMENTSSFPLQNEESYSLEESNEVENGDETELEYVYIENPNNAQLLDKEDAENPISDTFWGVEEETNAAEEEVEGNTQQQNIVAKYQENICPETETKKKTNKCSVCAKSFTKPVDLRRHLRVHTGEKPFKCDVCQKPFTLKSTLKTHLKLHSELKEKIPCQICFKNYSSKASLDLHMRIHSNEKPFRCYNCPLTFRTSGHLSAHLHYHRKLPKTQA